ncbi:hypothetical protein ACFLVN_01000 [Chloroflexota bacterium]
MAFIIVPEKLNKSKTVTDELCHDSLDSPSTDFSLNSYSRANTYTIPLTEGEKGQDLALRASSVLIRAERTPGAVAVSGINGRELAGVAVASPAGIPSTNSSLPPSPSPSPHQCGKYIILADCGSGKHHFAKRLDCNQEWCPVCGENGSSAHKHRVSKWIPKAQQMESLAYFVIEFPEIYRHLGAGGVNPDPDGGKFWCYSKSDLRATTNAIVDVLAGKRKGRRGRVGGFFERGLSRWHWFGEVCVNQRGRKCKLAGHRCPKVKCDDFINSGKWNPHLNVLVEGGYIDPAKLKEIKSALRTALNVPDLIVNYSFISIFPFYK